jgi:hypothetical protein
MSVPVGQDIFPFIENSSTQSIAISGIVSVTVEES